MTNFSAQVDNWVNKSEKRMTAIFKQSAQDVAIETTKTRKLGGHMRVDTGFLRASLLVSNNKMPKIDQESRPDKGEAKNSYSADSGTTTLVIASTQLGQTIYLGFTASYAAYRESKDGFVRLTAQRWKKIVAKNVAELKRRIR